MSDTVRRPYAQVLTVANAVADMLRPHCERVEIAGSLRRKKALVGDIEIVAIPKLHTDLLGYPLETSHVDDLFARIPVTLHKNGSKYKAFSFEWQPGMTFKVDLFLPNRDTWGVVYLLRTGSSDFSRRMVTAQSRGGFKPDVYTVEDGRVRMAGMLLPTPEETDVFERWKMAYVEPEQRI